MYPLFFSDFNETRIFTTDFWNNKYQISWKSIQCKPSCYLRMEKTGIVKLIAATNNYANAPKNVRFSSLVGLVQDMIDGLRIPINLIFL